MIPRLILCLGGNRRYPPLARRIGYDIGARLPGTVYAPLRFADQNWKKPNRDKYIAALARHRPETASVLDWEHHDQYDEVLSWAADAAQHVTESVIIVPKVVGGIDAIPRMIGGRRVILGYSVPTRHGGTDVPLWNFSGWPLHILGGSPRDQIHVALHHNGEVVQADGNMIHCAAGYGTYWRNGRWHKSKRHETPTSWALLMSLIHVAAEWRAAIS